MILKERLFKEGGIVAGNARREIESKTGRNAISAHSFKKAKNKQLS